MVWKRFDTDNVLYRNMEICLSIKILILTSKVSTFVDLHTIKQLKRSIFLKNVWIVGWFSFQGQMGVNYTKNLRNTEVF